MKKVISVNLMLMLGILVYAQDTTINKNSTPLNSGSGKGTKKGTTTPSTNGTSTPLNNSTTTPATNGTDVNGSTQPMNNSTAPVNNGTVPLNNGTVPSNNGGTPITTPGTTNPNGGTTTPHDAAYSGSATNAQERTMQAQAKGGFRNDTIPGQQGQTGTSRDSSTRTDTMTTTTTTDSSSLNSGTNNNNNSGMANAGDTTNNGATNKNTHGDSATANANNAAANADSTSTATTNLTDRVMMKEDKMYLVKNGESNLMEKSYKLASGAMVMTTGTVKYPGGRIVKLKNGQFIEITQKDKDADAGQASTTKKTIKKKTVSARKKTTKKQ